MKITKLDESVDAPKKRVNWTPVYEAAIGSPGVWIEAIEPGVTAGTIRNLAKELNNGRRASVLATQHGGEFEAMSRKRGENTALIVRFVKGEF